MSLQCTRSENWVLSPVNAKSDVSKHTFAIGIIRRGDGEERGLGRGAGGGPVGRGGGEEQRGRALRANRIYRWLLMNGSYQRRAMSRSGQGPCDKVSVLVMTQFAFPTRGPHSSGRSAIHDDTPTVRECGGKKGTYLIRSHAAGVSHAEDGGTCSVG